jgi:hypothetical protein
MFQQVFCVIGSSNIDWIALGALSVAIISLFISVRYNRRTFRLTEVHNKKTVEPLITDTITANIFEEKDRISTISYQIKNCGLGPGIVKSLIFQVGNESFDDIVDVYRRFLGEDKFLQNPSYVFTINSNHVLSPNDTLELFKLFFPSYNDAFQFTEFCKRVSCKIEYYTIYGERKEFLETVAF